MSGAVLVDTDVFSFWLKQDTRGKPYEADARGKGLCLSFMTVAEVKRWALGRNWGPAKIRVLAESIERCTIVDYDNALADAWAQVTHERARIGRPIECGDAWIAATSVRHDLPLLTHNAKHFRGITGLRVVSHA